MKILITGGGGFQGSHLANHFISKGHTVTVLNTDSKLVRKNISAIKKPCTVVFGSVTDKDLVYKIIAKQDVVFHLAAKINVDESLIAPEKFITTNVEGTLNVLKAVNEYGIRLIHASTCEVYGFGHNTENGNLLTETSALSPNSPYAASKAAADLLCQSYVKSFGSNVTIVRPFNVFGERQKDGMFGALIPIMVRKAIAGESLVVFGEGTAKRDFMYISDMVRAYDLLLDNSDTSGEIINFASGVSTSVIDIVTYIAKKLDSKIEFVSKRPGEVEDFPADVLKANKLGWKSEISIFEGIDKYIDWAKNSN